MLLFWRRKKKKVNVAELSSIKINRVESKFYSIEDISPKEKYSIETVAKNLPLTIGESGQIFVTARYNGIPSMCIYFFIKLKDLQGTHVTRNNTVDIKIKAEIKKGECKSINLEVFPASDMKGGLLPCAL